MKYFSILLLCFSVKTFAAHINGFVKDASNGEKLAYANVYLEGTTIGGSTSEKGYYIIQNVPSGKYTIVALYMGYKTIKKDIELKEKNITLNFELSPDVIKMKEVTVTAKRMGFEKNIEGSKTEFTIRDIKTIPKFFEGDLMKVIQTMPGVISLNDLSNKLYIRGGSPDENLVLLDKITIYNASTHLFGLFSTFNPDAVSDVKMFSGSFPARYGDRLSSIIEVETKEGNNKKYTGSASVGLISSKLLVEGPIPKGSFLLSGRRSYLDLIVWGYSKLFNNDISLPYYFWDGVAKFNFNPSQENRFNLTAFGGSDIIDFAIPWQVTENGETKTEEIGSINMNWGNQGLSGRWRKIFTPKLYGEIVGVSSKFFTSFGVLQTKIPIDTSTLIDSTIGISIHQDITDYSIKGDLTYYLNPKNTINTGFDIMQNEFTDKQVLTFDSIYNFSSPTTYSNKLSAYIEGKTELSPLLTLRTGLRGIYYSTVDKTVLDPSMGIKYLLRQNTSLKLEIGRYHQFMYTLNSQESFFSLYDMWKPLDAKHSPPEAWHFTLGLAQWIGEDGEFSIDGYYKKYNSLLIPPEEGGGGDFGFSSSPPESLKVANGYATGIELQYKKSFSFVHGWLNYTLGFTRRNTDSSYYFPSYDKRHNFNIVLGTSYKKYNFNLKWYLSTGSPFANDLARYKQYYDDDSYSWGFIKGKRDASRLPASHRLDIEAERSITIPLLHWHGSMYLGIVNLYIQKNVLFYDWITEEGQEPNKIYYDPPKKQEISILPILIPNYGITINF
ncbi:MAG: TonB-dependent receptor [bacterium]|nr:TonB-dependent receptor [bacterium]